LQALQLFFVMFVRPSAAPREAFPMAAEGFFPGYRGVNFTGDLLATVGMSLFCISVPLGMGQAYIGLQAEEPSFMVVLAVFPVLAALAVLWIRFTVVRDAHTRIMRFWMVAQLFILAAVVCHVAFPEFNVPGNTLMRSSSLFIWGFTWFITIAFINYGWRSPIYYCIAGWFSFSFSQMVGRDASYLLFGTGANATIILAIMAGFLLVADQLLLSRYYTLLSAADEGGRVPLGSPHLIHGIMGLTTDTEDTPGVSLDQRREAYMERARLMGKQYLLNEREVEIIALYVLGFTHRKISEELFLSSETVHTYIKRIYKKTNLHSRQELIDYINEYLS
jgi:DNA-binding CsgD family transcriptional regulator